MSVSALTSKPVTTPTTLPPAPCSLCAQAEKNGGTLDMFAAANAMLAAQGIAPETTDASRMTSALAPSPTREAPGRAVPEEKNRSADRALSDAIRAAERQPTKDGSSTNVRSSGREGTTTNGQATQTATSVSTASFLPPPQSRIPEAPHAAGPTPSLLSSREAGATARFSDATDRAGTTARNVQSEHPGAPTRSYGNTARTAYEGRVLTLLAAPARDQGRVAAQPALLGNSGFASSGGGRVTASATSGTSGSNAGRSAPTMTSSMADTRASGACASKSPAAGVRGVAATMTTRSINATPTVASISVAGRPISTSRLESAVIAGRKFMSPERAAKLERMKPQSQPLTWYGIALAKRIGVAPALVLGLLAELEAAEADTEHREDHARVEAIDADQDHESNREEAGGDANTQENQDV